MYVKIPNDWKENINLTMDYVQEEEDPTQLRGRKMQQVCLTSFRKFPTLLYPTYPTFSYPTLKVNQD